jgi:hypothetical protein
MTNDNPFVERLSTLLVDEFSNNFSRLGEIIRNISIDRLSQQQRAIIAFSLSKRTRNSWASERYISAFLSYRTSSLLLLLDMSYISMIAN